MRKNKTLTIISYCFFIAVTIVIFAEMIRIIHERNLDYFSINSPALYSTLVGAMMAVCLVISLISEFRGRKNAGETGETEKAGDAGETSVGGRHTLLVLLLFVGLLVYIFLMRMFGFLITTPVYLFIFMFILCDLTPLLKRFLVSAGIALAMTFALYFVFSEIFSVLLP